jgi:hypothetical protein
MRNERPSCSLKLIVDLSFTSIEICGYTVKCEVQHRNILATKGFFCVLIALFVEWMRILFCSMIDAIFPSHIMYHFTRLV